MPRVSVIIPTYNQPEYLPAAIESALAQTEADHEVIVVNDGSTDSTGDVAERFCGHGPVKVIHQPNEGRSAARNRGLAAASGEYVAFLDGDDLLLPDKLATQTAFLDRYPALGLVYGDAQIWPDGAPVDGPLRLAPGSRRACAGWVFEPLVRGNPITLHSALVRRWLLEAVGGFDARLGGFEDWDLWLRVAERAPFAYVRGAVARYRLHPNMTTANLDWMWRGRLMVRRKIEAHPALATLSPATQAHHRWQLGLLEALAGDLSRGRSLLHAAAFGQPPSRPALLTLLLALAGRRLIREVARRRAGDWRTLATG